MRKDAGMSGRSLLTLYDLTDEELRNLLDLSARLKRAHGLGEGGRALEGKTVALLFEKSSTRTRCAAVTAAAQEGGRAEYLSSADIHLGRKESVADTARVLGRMFDGIMFRGFRQETVASLARYAGVPVWNGLTDESHPTQALADLLTVEEKFGRLKGLKLVYVGDGRNNVANSLMAGCAKSGMHFVNCTPEPLFPAEDLVDRARQQAARNGCRVEVTTDVQRAVEGAHAVYTDVWVSMGEETRFAERVELLRPYQVDMALMRRTGRLDTHGVIFLHCLPAFHNSDTEVTRDSGALEVTDDVFEAPFSRVFDQAENRMHTIKAVMVAALAGRGRAPGGKRDD